LLRVLFSLKLKICDINNLALFFPQKLVKVVEVILEINNLFPKKLPIFLENKIKNSLKTHWSWYADYF
jgi:hypothetical protein